VAGSPAGADGRRVEVHSLSALLHNRPGEIPSAVEQLASRLQAEGREVVVAYADCGTYGGIGAMCERLGLRRLPGLHCYDLIAGEDVVSALLAEQPGTYLLTDFLLGGFRRLVIAELGLDRHPELVQDYFGHYTRLVWLTSSADPRLMEEARGVASLLHLELEVHRVEPERLDGALRALVRSSGPTGPTEPVGQPV
jgi:hypothetical protein